MNNEGVDNGCRSTVQKLQVFCFISREDHEGEPLVNKIR